MLKIQPISVKTRLLLMLFIPLVLFATTSIYLLNHNTSNVNHMSDTLYETGSRSASLVLNADRDMYQVLTDYLKIRSDSFDQSLKDAAYKDYKENLTQIKDRLTEASKLVMNGGLENLTHPESGQTLTQIIKEVQDAFTLWVQQTESNIQNPKNSADGESKLLDLFERARNHVDQFGDIIEIYQKQVINEAIEENKQITYGTYTALIIEWTILIAAGILLIRQISRTVRIIREKAHRVSDGYLDVPQQSSYSKDEFGRIQQSVDAMIARMRDLIGNIASSSHSVAEASEQLSISANESSSAATHVAENIQEVTSLVEIQSTITSEASKAMEEMAIGVQRIAESTGVISDHATETNAQADHGNELLIKLKEQMDEMTKSIDSLNQCVTVLNEKSERIGAITENITSFANQTGILSLNASIEAARAGEHGRGFAVVAGEIRKLAANSLESANIINDLVSETRNEIGSASAFMQSTVAQAERSGSLMEEVAEGFQSIVVSIKQVAAQIHDTSAVTEQMSASSEEVSASMEQSSSSVREVANKAESVAAATEEQLALVESIAESAEQLRDIVRNLNTSVSYFKL